MLINVDITAAIDTLRKQVPQVAAQAVPMETLLAPIAAVPNAGLLGGPGNQLPSASNDGSI